MATNSTTYLTRTQSSGTSDKIGTFSAWIKYSEVGETNSIFSGHTDSSNRIALYIGGSGALTIYGNIANSQSVYLITNNLLRDVSAWYHIVVAWDTTQGTDSNRFKIYVNGSQITSFSTAAYPSVNADVYWNKGTTSIVGARFISSVVNYFSGSMANVEFVDGQQLTPAYFGSTDSTTGIWTPQASSTISSYGTNGFKLKMDTATPGADTSGNTNTFTVGGGTPTLTQGSPSNVYATMNPLGSGAVTFSNGNNTVTRSGSGWLNAIANIGASSGKWYVEAKAISIGSVTYGSYTGFVNLDVSNAQNTTTNFGETNDTTGISSGGGYIYYNTGQQFAGPTTATTNGDIVTLAMDLDNGFLYWGINGNWVNSGVPTSGATGTGGMAISYITADGTYTFGQSIREGANYSWNFGEGFFGTTAAGTQADDNGQGLFAYDVPAGYYALNTKNLEAYG